MPARDGIGIKLPAVRVTALIARGRATHFQPYGRPPMREWAYFDASTPGTVKRLRGLIAEALDHASTLAR